MKVILADALSGANGDGELLRKCRCSACSNATAKFTRKSSPIAGWKGYSGLVDLGYKKHHRVDHGRNGFVKHKAHINGSENFWGLAKMRLAKFRGLNRATLHLKECEFRFNHRRDNLYQLLLKDFKNNLLN
jgi:transposase